MRGLSDRQGKYSHPNGQNDCAAIAHDGPEKLRELIPSLLLRRRRRHPGCALAFALPVLGRGLFGSRPGRIVVLNAQQAISRA